VSDWQSHQCPELADVDERTLAPLQANAEHTGTDPFGPTTIASRRHSEGVLMRHPRSANCKRSLTRVRKRYAS
jgi:hypothetical protein